MLTPEQTAALGLFPLVMQKLVQEELQAGNSIVEIESGFPAPPIGMYLRLAKPITTRPRKTDSELTFVDRNFGSYSGEVTDAGRVFFIIETRQSDPSAYPDMETIRNEMDARQRAADADMSRSSRS